MESLWHFPEILHARERAGHQPCCAIFLRMSGLKVYKRLVWCFWCCQQVFSYFLIAVIAGWLFWCWRWALFHFGRSKWWDHHTWGVSGLKVQNGLHWYWMDLILSVFTTHFLKAFMILCNCDSCLVCLLQLDLVSWHSLPSAKTLLNWLGGQIWCDRWRSSFRFGFVSGHSRLHACKNAFAM